MKGTTGQSLKGCRSAFDVFGRCDQCWFVSTFTHLLLVTMPALQCDKTRENNCTAMGCESLTFDRGSGQAIDLFEIFYET